MALSKYAKKEQPSHPGGLPVRRWLGKPYTLHVKQETTSDFKNNIIT